MDGIENLIQEIEEKGYCEINDNTVIYIDGTNLKNYAVGKLETMLDDSYYVSVKNFTYRNKNLYMLK